MYLAYREPAADIIRVGDLSISPSGYEVTVKGNPVSLRYREYELFKFLITHPDRVFSRRELLADVWGNPPSIDSRTVDVHIRRVREKLGDTGCKYIRTVRGVGYVFRSNGF